ncbi:MAG TPA: CHAT domain-containing protein, partial [Thermoanaerobaculia bacterium]|nr:CHAT domain-containing protein [Thermoanaerobaculia bacterium]
MSLLSASDTYVFDLKPGWLLHLSVEQRGTDIVVRVLAPNGHELFRVDSPKGTEGTEEVWLVAQAAGAYRIKVEPWGKQRIKTLALRPATDEDRINAAAERDYLLAFQREKDGERLWLERMYLRAARAWESLGRTEREAEARFRLGRILGERGDWTGALEAFRRARSLYHLAGSRPAEMLALDRIADAYQTLGRVEEARRTLQETVLRWRMLRETWNEVATSYRICQLLHVDGRASESLQCYERVLEGWQKLGAHEQEGWARVDIGTLYTSLGDLGQAFKSFREALKLLPPGSNGRGAVLNQIGTAYLKAGHAWRAQFWFREALVSGGREATALTGLGLVWKSLGKSSQALSHFRHALTLLDQPSEKATVLCHMGRLYLSMDQMRLASAAFKKALLLGDRKAQAEALSGLARTARKEGDLEQASYLMERSLALVESLRGDIARDLLKATYLASKRADYDFLIDLLMEHGRDLEALKVHERALARSLADRLGSAPLPPLESLLDEDTALLEYSLGEERSYLWWITRTELATFELPGRSDLEPAIRQYHHLLSRRRASLSEIDRSSREIFQLLLEPVASRLSHRRIVIVAPDILQYVPFETLLIDCHEVVRMPSLTVLARMRKRSPRPRNGLALVGDAVFNRLDGRLPSYVRGPESGLKRLGFVDDEVQSVLRKARNGRVLVATGFDAVREVVTGGALAGFSILHFNGHGRPDGILLTRLDHRGLPRPGWLTSEEVGKLRLNADLVVLSACQTALGREVRGEGLVGLSQSFLAAGASSVLGSLWSVDDKATAHLMDRFYRELLVHGRPPSE